MQNDQAEQVYEALTKYGTDLVAIAEAGKIGMIPSIYPLPSCFLLHTQHPVSSRDLHLCGLFAPLVEY